MGRNKLSSDNPDEMVEIHRYFLTVGVWSIALKFSGTCEFVKAERSQPMKLVPMAQRPFDHVIRDIEGSVVSANNQAAAGPTRNYPFRSIIPPLGDR